MKKFIPVILFFVLNSSFSARATVHIIEAYNNYFTPDSMTVLVGDTIQWNWVEGIHTTSSNGIPDTAAPWNMLLDSAHAIFMYEVLVPGSYYYISIPNAPGMNGFFEALSTSGVSTINSPQVSLDLLRNPVSDKLSMKVTMPSSSHAEIRILDLFGKQQEVLTENYFHAGVTVLTIPLKEDFVPGLYVIVLKTGNAFIARKVVIW